MTDGALRHFQYGSLEFNIIRAVTHPTKKQLPITNYLLSQMTDGALRHFQYGNLEFNTIRAVTHPTRNDYQLPMPKAPCPMPNAHYSNRQTNSKNTTFTQLRTHRNLTTHSFNQRLDNR